jgi:hypothetical protein
MRARLCFPTVKRIKTESAESIEKLLTYSLRAGREYIQDINRSDKVPSLCICG